MTPAPQEPHRQATVEDGVYCCPICHHTLDSGFCHRCKKEFDINTPAPVPDEQQKCFGIEWVSGQPCNACDNRRECSEKYFELNMKEHDALVAQQAKQEERDRVLKALSLWRIKRMKGMLKKAVWQGWNEETDFIDSLRQQEQP